MAEGPCAGLRGHPWPGSSRLRAADPRSEQAVAARFGCVSRGCLVLTWTTHLRETPSGGGQKEVLTPRHLHHTTYSPGRSGEAEGGGHWWSVVVTEPCPARGVHPAAVFPSQLLSKADSTSSAPRKTIQAGAWSLCVF